MTPSRPSLLQFPCYFPLKVIGKNVEEFEIQVMSIVHKHVIEADTAHCKRRLSAGNKYLALTISFMAQSREQLEAIYTELKELELVMVML
jgi:putative lipoic acid-binding regulatory protein